MFIFKLKMLKINFSEIFPTRWSFVVFILYMFLFVCQGLSITKSQESSNVYNYNTILAVFLAEFVKLVICFIIYCSRNTCFSFYEQTLIHLKLLWLYFIPAFLYCLYNNLSYINLLHYDPATYFILLQLRVVITGILFQVLFSKILNLIQWTSLILLTIGCMIKNIDFNYLNIYVEIHSSNQSSNSSDLSKMDGMGLNYSTMLILFQVLCSCFAGVYSEFLLKNRGLHVNIFMQNIFLYFDSIICNILMLCWQWDLSLFSQKSVEGILQPMVLLVILINAMVGIVTSFFLKYLNSILKTVASALELIFITILSWLLFNIPIRANTILSIFVVSISIVIYSRNPVQNQPSTVHSKKENTENVSLL